MTLNQDGIQKPCFVIKLRGAVVPNSVLIFCMYVCLFVCLLFVLRRVRVSNKHWSSTTTPQPLLNPSLYPKSRSRTSFGEIQSSLGTPLPSYK